ncbi:MAG: flagellar biosynthesis protein FlhA [Actinomycetota bacterium]|nr:flagellar biosynthesis protein FlhA [Actinomycetota bacterium]
MAAPISVAASRSRMALIGVPFGIVSIIAVMVVPLPSALVDLLLAFNISLAILILVTSMAVKDPLEFSVFPALLLVTTLFRLALNVSTTRLILGQGFAGKIVEAFGMFVVAGSVIIGLVVFLILVVIQFAVITNGAGRVAEVGARFVLDAMPGKQMAIDADLNAGLITDTVARQRRLEVTREADFYGAMDGASKFVKGDAIAGLVIVAINLIGGIAVGVLQFGLGVGESVQRFALLAVGDGLVSQLPALLISVASGIIVTRVSTDGDGGLGGDLWMQLLRNARVLGIGAAAVTVLSFVPGLPRVPFLVIGVTLAVSALRARSAAEEAPLELEAAEPEPELDESEVLREQLRVEPLELELSPDLFDLVDPDRGGNLLDRVRALRRQLARELGLVVPLVRTRDNLTLPPAAYVIQVNGVEAGSGEAPPGHVLVLADGAVPVTVGRATTEPVYGLPASWVPADLAEHLELQGATVVDRGSVIITHLSDIARRYAPDLLSRQVVHELVESLRDTSPTVVGDVGTDRLPLSEVQEVLRGLLREGVSIRDLASILEAVSAAPTMRTEDRLAVAREALAPAICAAAAKDGVMSVLTFEPALEQQLLENMRQTDGGPQFAAPPELTERLINAVDRALAEQEELGHQVAIVCSPQLRTTIRRLVVHTRPLLPVIAYSELRSNVEVESRGVIRLE